RARGPHVANPDPFSLWRILMASDTILAVGSCQSLRRALRGRARAGETSHDHPMRRPMRTTFPALVLGGVLVAAAWPGIAPTTARAAPAAPQPPPAPRLTCLAGT